MPTGYWFRGNIQHHDTAEHSETTTGKTKPNRGFSTSPGSCRIPRRPKDLKEKNNENYKDNGRELALFTGGFAGECSSVALPDVVVRVLVERPIHEALRADRS